MNELTKQIFKELDLVPDEEFYIKPTEDDLAVLKYAKLCGAKYVAQDKNGDIFMYFQRPHKYAYSEFPYLINTWTNTDKDYLQIHAPISFISWEDDEPVCIERYV